MLDSEPLNAVQVAALLHVGRNKVYDMAQSGDLPSYRIGRKLLFSPDDVQRFLEARHRGSRAGSAGGASGAGGERTGAGRPMAAPSEGYLEGLIRPEGGFTVAGEGLFAGLAVEALAAAGCKVAHLRVNGYAALVGMYLGEVDAACTALYDAKTNSYNAAFVQRLAPGVAVASVCLAEQRRGFAVAEGNPKKIATWGGLLKDGVRLAQLDRGSAGRILLDEKLMMLEARPENIIGYDGAASGGFAAVRRVASGLADVAVCSEGEARGVPGVQFVPMQAERVDVVVRKCPRTRGFLKAAKGALAAGAFRETLSRATGADCSRTGSVVYES